MTNKINRVKGVKDILPADIATWQAVEETAREIFELYSFSEIRLPVFEKTEVFARSIGETSDIVEKEMYTFSDRGGESLTLRPEGTASAVRAFIENSMYNLPGVQKLYYTGPMFRAERPQAGRFRQFYQMGVEVFGTDDPAADAELILMLLDLLNALEVNGVEVKLNSLGCPECRPAYRDALRNFLMERLEGLCENCQRRVESNPLRALDCKSKTCKETVADAPTIDGYLCQECKDHFAAVTNYLKDLEAPFVLDPRLVRGLDYYSRTAFEVTSASLGAQNAIAGGGRYNTLVEEFGGPPTPAIGFALGMERLVSMLNLDVEPLMPEIYIVGLGEAAKLKVFETAHRLRSAGYFVERSFGGGNMKKLMNRADKSGARFAVIIGEDELAKDEAVVKDMESGEQKRVSLSRIADELEREVMGEYDEEQPPLLD